MSYGAPDSTLNSLSERFYRTIPSDVFISEALLSLINRFEWRRVGLLHSHETTYMRVNTTSL